MKPNINRNAIHAPHPRKDGVAQAPLRFSFREVVAQAKRDHGKEVSCIVGWFCFFAACAVLGLHGIGAF